MLTPDDLDALVAALRVDEGVERFPYVDTVGKLTVGVGRNLTDRGLRDDEIDLMLTNDLDEVDTQMGAAFPWARHLGPVRRRVLANMLFNLGLPRLQLFRKALAAMQRGDYVTAAREMRASKWASQVGARAERLALEMETGREA